MTNNPVQTDVSLVFTDQDQNYYMIPAEVFQRGRVPAERKAEVEEALREHEVTGYNPLVIGGAAFALGTVAATGGMMIGGGLVFGGYAMGKAARKAYDAYTTEANNSSTPIGSGDTPTVYREG